jgi:hypothetical protein
LRPIPEAARPSEQVKPVNYSTIFIDIAQRAVESLAE